jgi:hypothetical protein
MVVYLSGAAGCKGSLAVSHTGATVQTATSQAVLGTTFAASTCSGQWCRKMEPLPTAGAVSDCSHVGAAHAPC